jgi:hypothetical protein
MMVAVTICLSAILMKFIHGGWIWIPVAIIIAVTIVYFLLFKKISDDDVTNYIDRTFPFAEESASLLLKPEQELNYFERRQIDKINKQWTNEIVMPLGIRRRFTWAIGSLMGAAVFAMLIYFIPIKKSMKGPGFPHQTTTELNEKKLAGISGVSLTITPPSYTGRPEREQNFFNIQVEEGGMIQWSVKTTLPADSMSFIFNDSTELPLNTRCE